MNRNPPVVRRVFLRWLAVICSIILAGGYVFFSHALHAGRMFSSSKATSTLETLRLLDEACDKWAVENGQSPGSNSILLPYVKTDSKLYTDLKDILVPAPKDLGTLSTPPLSLTFPPQQASPPATPAPAMLPGSKSFVPVIPAQSVGRVLFGPEHPPK